MTARPSFLLASDLDGTLIPPSDSARRREGLTRFAEVVDGARPRLALAYVTGRDLGLAKAGVEQWALPVPDFLACDVGTTLYRRHGDGFEPDDAYAALMRDAFGGAEASDVLRALEDVPGVRPQPSARQGAHKVSFFFSWEERRLVDTAVVRRLAEAEVRADLVISRDAVTGEGLLDVLPAGGAKDRATAYLAAQLGLSLDRVVFAGDSGNDLEALLSGTRSVLVGNAADHVRAGLRAQARARSVEDRVYLAAAEVAEGVVEGLVHWGVVPG